MKKEIPIWEKYTLNVEEAAIYYGIGIKRLYEIIRSNPNADFLLEIGSHYRIFLLYTSPSQRERG